MKKNWKKYHRKVNKVIRYLNKNIEDDSVWAGRFVMFQKSVSMKSFDDGSGHYFVYIIRLYDKETRIYRDELFHTFSGSHFALADLFYFMNRFINLCADEVSYIRDYRNELVPKRIIEAPATPLVKRVEVNYDIF